MRVHLRLQLLGRRFYSTTTAGNGNGSSTGFDFGRTINWFPGHMNKGLRVIRQQLANIDLLIETRDARIPLSSINPLLEAAGSSMPVDDISGSVHSSGQRRLVLYNKVDLAIPSSQMSTGKQQQQQQKRQARLTATQQDIADALRLYRGHDCMFTNTNEPADIKRVISYIKRFAEERLGIEPGSSKPPLAHLSAANLIASHGEIVSGNSQSGAPGARTVGGIFGGEINVLIMGMPNVGKSSLINALRRLGDTGRKSKVAQVGASPGVTRALSTRIRILDWPRVYLYDTPGVMVPHIADPEMAFKVALTGGIADAVADPERLAAFLLYTLNRIDPSRIDYVEEYGLPARTDNVMELLNAVAKKTGALFRGGIPDIHTAAWHFIRRYRKGDFGQYMIDDVSQEGLRRFFAPNQKADSLAVGIATSKRQQYKALQAARKERSRARRASKGNQLQQPSDVSE